MIFSQFSFYLFLVCVFLILLLYTVKLEMLFTCSLCRFATDSIQSLNWRQCIIVLDVSLLYKETPVLEAVAFRSCSNVYRQQTCLSNLQIKCKTANDRWWRQTGKNKKQTNSTTRVLDGGHSTADSAHSLWAAVAGRKAREQ